MELYLTLEKPWSAEMMGMGMIRPLYSTDIDIHISHYFQ